MLPAQRITQNEFVSVLDELFDSRDTMIGNRGFNVVNKYECMNCKQQACILKSQKIFDKSGKLIKYKQGKDLITGNIEYEVTFKTLSKDVYEGTAVFISDIPKPFFIDSVVSGKRTNYLLYKKNEIGILSVKSIYYADSNIKGMAQKIERFDSDNNLVEVLYPLGNRLPKIDSFSTLIGLTDSIIRRYIEYSENCVDTKWIYNKNGKLIETIVVNKTFENKDAEYTKEVFIYNEQYLPAFIIGLDEQNKFLYEKRLYYNKGKLRHYIEKYDTLEKGDSENEEVWNLKGQKIISRFKHVGYSDAWYYEYYPSGLTKRIKWFKNDKMGNCWFFSYAKDNKN